MRGELVPTSNCFLTACVILAVTASPSAARTCSKPFEVPDRTYYRLSIAWPAQAGLTNSFVWVEDITSRLFGGYRPFDVYVIVGKNYAPFSQSSGRLNRRDFNIINGKSANNEFTQWRIDSSKLVPRPFTAGSVKYLLTVVDVDNAYFAENDSITLKICTE